MTFRWLAIIQREYPAVPSRSRPDPYLFFNLHAYPRRLTSINYVRALQWGETAPRVRRFLAVEVKISSEVTFMLIEHTRKATYAYEATSSSMARTPVPRYYTVYW